MVRDDEVCFCYFFFLILGVLASLPASIPDIIQ